MNLTQSKHYSLLLQDDRDATYYEGVREETIMEEEEEEESVIGGEAVVVDSKAGKSTTEETDDEEEEIFTNGETKLHKAMDSLKLNARQSTDYRLLNNGDTDSSSSMKTASDVSTIEYTRLTTIWTPTPMSPARRACVLASVMLGVLVTVVFVWVMPCGVDDVCGAPKVNTLYPGVSGDFDDNFRDTWMQVIDNTGSNMTLSVISRRGVVADLLMTFYHPPNLTSSDDLWSSLLRTTRCSYEGVKDSPSSDSDSPCGGEESQESALSCGVMMMRGDTGEVVWQRPVRECPVRTMCHLMDGIDSDDNPACLIIGDTNLLSLFDPITGKVKWETTPPSGNIYETNETESSLLYPGKPVLIPDVTGDSKPDLLFPGLVKNSNSKIKSEIKIHSYRKFVVSSDSRNDDKESWFRKKEIVKVNDIVLVSGATGRIIGNPLVLKQCQTIIEFSDDGESIDYTCLMDSGNKLAGKIPLSSLIQQIMTPDQPTITDNDTQSSTSAIFPSIIPFVPTPDEIANRYCQVEVKNKGVCPLCESTVKLLSNVEGESEWQVEYDGTVVLDWKPLVTSSRCKGVLLKIIAWDEMADMVDIMDSAEHNVNQRTPRSSYSKSTLEEDEDLETDEDEIVFSGVGENLEDSDYKITRLNKASIPKLSINRMQRDEASPNFNERISRQKRPSEVKKSYFGKSRHSKLWYDYNDRKSKKFGATSPDNSKFLHKDYFLPIQDLNSDKFKSYSEDSNKDTNKAEDKYHIDGTRERFRIQDLASPKIAALYAKDLDNKQDDYTTIDDFIDYTHSAMDFDLPINVFGLPIDIQPPDGFSLQRLTEYILLVHYNGSDWLDMPLKKTPIFQLCKDTVCIPNESYCDKLVIDKIWGEANLWSAINSVTTVTHTVLETEDTEDVQTTDSSLETLLGGVDDQISGDNDVKDMTL